jgi:hypothetical protein
MVMARPQQKGPRFARGPSSGVFGCYFSPSSLAGAALPFLEPELMPVVLPDFALLVFILSDFILPDFMLGAPGPALPSLDAPAAGCVCADAIAVAPNNDAIMRAEIASLDRMNNLLLWMCDAGVELATRICVPGSAAVFFGRDCREFGYILAVWCPRTGLFMDSIVRLKDVSHQWMACFTSIDASHLRFQFHHMKLFFTLRQIALQFILPWGLFLGILSTWSTR